MAVKSSVSDIEKSFPFWSMISNTEYSVNHWFGAKQRALYSPNNVSEYRFSNQKLTILLQFICVKSNVKFLSEYQNKRLIERRAPKKDFIARRSSGERSEKI